MDTTQNRSSHSQRGMSRRALVGAAGSLATAAILAACGGADAPTGATGAAAPSTGGATVGAGATRATGATSATVAPAGATAGAGTPRKGGTLVVAMDSDPEILDPHITTNLMAQYAITLMCDTLLTRDYDGSLKPGLAEKWEVSPDGKTYTLTLKKGVKFHSGKDLTAADVKYTFERWKGLPNAPNGYTIAPIDTVDAPDAQTVRFNLKSVYNIFLDQLAGNWSVILNKDVVEKAGKDYGVTAVDGTGPFKFISWTRGQKLVMARNDGYTWGATIFQNPGPAYLDGVEFRPIPEDNTRVAEFQAGNIQILTQVPGAEAERLGKAQGVSVVQYAQLATTYMGINTKKPPFDDAKVRQAINHAINKDEVIKGALYGLGTPAATMMHPNAPYYAKGIEQSAYGFDAKKAASLLDEAGWKPGSGGVREKNGQQLVMPLWSFNTTLWTTEAQIIQQQLGNVGIKVDIKTFEGAAMFAALRAGDHVAYHLDFYYEIPDAVYYFYFYSKQQPSPNRFYYGVPEVDMLLEDTRTNLDKAAVTQGYDKIQRRVLADAPSVPLYHQMGTVGKTAAVQGLKVHPSRWLYKMTDLWLTK